MDAVKVMLKRGVEKIRDSLVTFSKQLNPNIDTIELEEAAVTFPARWKSYNIAVKNGADITAYNRYKAWHEAVITDGLELNPTYVPPTTVTSSGAEPDVNGSSKASANHSRGCSKCKHTSTSLPPIHKVRQA
jgi:calcineurin-like phosphoesterase